MKTSQERASQQSQTLAPTRFTNPPPFFPQPTSSVLYWECRSLFHPFPLSLSLLPPSLSSPPATPTLGVVNNLAKHTGLQVCV